MSTNDFGMPIVEGRVGEPIKGRIGVLIEEHFDQTEFLAFNAFFPAHGYQVEYISHLWGNDHLVFRPNPDDGVMKVAASVSTEIEAVGPTRYRGVILIGAYAMDRLRYQATMQPGQPNRAPAVDFLRAALQTSGLKIGTICHSLWLFCADRSLLTGRRVTCASNIVCDVENAGGQVIYDATQPAAIVVDGDLITGRHPGVVDLFLATFLEELERPAGTGAPYRVLADNALVPAALTIAEEPDQEVDAIVVGSGFGGSIAALRLAEKGIATVVLERGQRWQITDREDTFCTYREPDGRAAWLRNQTVVFDPKPISVHAGILDETIGDGITVWTAAGVGGGSLVYNTVLLQPSRQNFEKVMPCELSYDEMDRFYRRVESVMQPERIPQDVLDTDYYLSTRLFINEAEAAKLPYERINVASSWEAVRQEIGGKKKPAAIAGEIWYGINSGVKKSLDRNYLAQAEASGKVDVRPLHVVTSIGANGTSGFVVRYARIDVNGNVQGQGQMLSRRLFLAAGSMGTTSLLVRAKGRGTLPALHDQVGQQWGNNGDSFATRQMGRFTNGGQGGPASVAVFDQDNPVCPTTLIVYPEWDAADDTLTTLAMATSDTFGEIRYDRVLDTVSVHWPSGDPKAQRTTTAASDTYKRLDPRVAAAPGGGVTAHPLGGAVMGKACDAYGRVAGYKGLYVVDGSLIPGYAGAANPAFTIAAVAERCMEKILQDDLGQ